MAAESSGSGFPFEHLPKVVREEVTSFFDAVDLAALSRVSKVFQRVIDNNPVLWTKVANKLNVNITNSKDPKQDVLAYYKEQNDAVLKQWAAIGKVYFDKGEKCPFLANLKETPNIFYQRRIIEKAIEYLNPKWRRVLFASGGTDGNLEIIKFFLKFYPPSHAEQQFALYLAIAHGKKDVVQFFLEKNPSLFEKSKKLTHVIALAKKCGHHDVAKLASGGQALLENKIIDDTL